MSGTQFWATGSIWNTYLPKQEEAQDLRFFGMYRYLNFQTNQEQLDRYALFVTDRHESTDALTQGQLEHARLFNFGKRKRAQFLLNAAPIVGHQRVRNA